MVLDFLKKSSLKKKRGKKKPESFDDPGNGRVAAFILTLVLAGVAGLAFFSAEVAILALGFTALGAAIFFEREKPASSQLDVEVRNLRADHEELAREVKMARKDIDALRRQAAAAPGAKKQAASHPVIDAANDDPEALTGLSDMVVRELVRQAAGRERIDVFIQPVVRLPQRKMRFFEMYARVRAKPGLYLPAARYRDIAQEDRVLETIDDLLLVHCLNVLRSSAHIKRAAPFFLNIAPATLRHADFMKDLLSFAARHRALAPRLIFEMKHADFDSLSIPVLQIIDGLGKIGCSFSLDHVNVEKLDVALLQKYKVRFVKVDAQRLIAGMKSERSFAEVMKVKRKLEANGIGFIAEKIENEHTMKELLDYDIHYGQGYLFGKPDLEGAYRARKAA